MANSEIKRGFIGLPRIELDALDAPSVVVFGAAEASPYVLGEESHSHDAPAAIRKAGQQFGGSLGQYDFDLDATMFPVKDDKRGAVDVGDLDTSAHDPEGNRARITAATARILAAGGRPIVLGGDDSVPIPFLAGFEGHGPLTILHVDAHVDWADVIRGNALGYGSPMRRASEYPWVTGMVQVGIRGMGSGESWQHDDARAWGSRIFTSYDLHRGGLDQAIAAIPSGARVVISIDCDGIDPATFPAVAMPTPGGLTYEDMVTLITGTAARAQLMGLALVEYVPARDDRHRLSGLIAARLASITCGLMLDQSTR